MGLLRSFLMVTWLVSETVSVMGFSLYWSYGIKAPTYAGEGHQQIYWTEAVQVTKTNERPDLSSEGAPDIDKTVTVKQELISGHKTQMGLDTKTDWPTDRRS
jgi:hypothetical protein